MTFPLLNQAIKNAFLDAGWYSGRTTSVASEVSQSHPAYQVLSEFGGLCVGRTGAGEEVATSNIEFGYHDFHDEDIDAWQSLLNTEFVCVGVFHNGHGHLWLEGHGRLVSSSDIHRFVMP